MLTTVDAVIEALGGATPAASLVGVGPSALSNWRDRGKIPADKFMLIRGALADLGKDVDPGVFAFKAVDEARA